MVVLAAHPSTGAAFEPLTDKRPPYQARLSLHDTVPVLYTAVGNVPPPEPGGGSFWVTPPSPSPSSFPSIDLDLQSP